MTHRIQVIGDELMGADGEAATLFSEMVLCEYPTRPVQFAISPLVRYPLASVLSRAPCDIFGKLAERIVLGLGLHELRLGADAEKVFAAYFCWFPALDHVNTCCWHDARKKLGNHAYNWSPGESYLCRNLCFAFSRMVYKVSKKEKSSPISEHEIACLQQVILI